MMYSMDDRSNQRQVLFSIHKDTGYFIQSVTALRQFQSDKVQEKLVSEGAIPLKRDLYRELPFRIVIPEEQTNILPELPNREEAYIIYRIVLPLLWNITFAPGKAGAVCTDIYKYARADWKIRKDVL